MRAQRKAPPVHALPYIPVLKHYTPRERHYIAQQLQQKGSQFARQQGIKGGEASSLLAQVGDQSTRTAFQAYARSYLEQKRVEDAKSYDKLFGSHPDLKLSTRQKALSYRQYAALGGPHGEAKPGPKKPGGAGGLVAAVLPNVGKVLSQGIHPVAGVSWARAGQAAGQLAGPVASDLVNIPANIIPSTYQAVKVGAQTVGGNTAPAKKFYANDPVHLALTGQFRKAGKVFMEHPLATGLEVAGVKAGVARGIGGLGRRAGVKAFDVTGRAPLVDEATGISIPRHYSPDPLNKALQVSYDRMAGRKQQKLLRKAQAIEPASPVLEPGRAAQAAELRREAAQASPTRLSDIHAKRRTAATFGVNQRVASQGRTATMREVRQLRIPDRYAPLVRLVAEGEMHPTRHDAAAYADHAAEQIRRGNYPNSAAREESLRNQQVLRDAIADPKFDFSKLGPAARQYADFAEHGQRALIETAPEGPLRQERQQQFERRVVMPYAVRRMGGLHDPERGLVVPPTDPAMRAHINQAEHLALTNAERAKRSPTPENVTGAELAAQRVDQLRAEHYRPVSTEEIRQHMLNNPEQVIKNPAYLSQAPGVHGSRAFFRAFFNRARMPGGKKYTGQATRALTMDLHPTALLQQVVRTQQQTEAERGMNAYYQEHGVKDPKGQTVSYQTYGPANEAATELKARTGEDYVPIRISPFLSDKAQVEAALEGDLGTQHGLTDSPTRKVMEDALQATDGPGPWGLVRKASRDEALGQLQALGGGGSKAVQRLNYQFRQAVLPLSTKWLAGNVIEAALRAGVSGSGPGSYYTGRKLLAPKRAIPGVGAARPLARFEGAAKGPVRMPDTLAKLVVPALKGRNRTPIVERVAAEMYRNAGMTPEAAAAKAQRFAQMARERTVKGGHYASQEYFPYRGSEVFKGMGGRTAKLGGALGAFWRAPGPRNLAAIWHHFTHFVMQDVNARLEDQVQYAMAGKYAKKYLMDPQGIHVGAKAIEQAARGLVGTNEQAAMGRWIERAYGKYQDFPASQRRLIQTYTPFIPWTFNAINFLYHVLPKDHPVLTGVLASAYIDSQDYLRQHGLIIGQDQQVPSWLVGSVPEAGGKFLRLSRYTPAGVFQSDTGPLGTVAQNVLPQINGTLYALQGRDWTGNPLPGKPNMAAKIGIAADQLAEAMIPGIGQFHRIVIGATKTTRKARISQRLQREFNPFYPIQPTQKGGVGDKVSRAVDKALGNPKLDSGKLDSAIDRALSGKK